MWLEITSALPCSLDKTVPSSSARLSRAETLGLDSTSYGHPSTGSLWTTTAHPELDCRTLSGCTLCSSAVTPEVWEAPGLQWDNTSVQKGLPLPSGIWLSQNSHGRWLSYLVLANCPLLCSEDDPLGSYCYGLLAGSVAESTAGIGRMAFLKSPGAADSTGVSNICLPPAPKVCLKQL